MSFEPRPADFSGFVRAQNGRIVDGTGRPLLLRGMGIGNWLLPEGYMWKLSPGADSPRQIEALVERLVGPQKAADFWSGFRANFFNENDVARIAASGFDHIRLPINSRVVQTEDGEPIEAGLRLIDEAIEWCRRHRLWLLLDLHGAPGGQTGTNIDDSPNNKPELFMEPGYRANTIRLWEDLARRYRHETVVMGYDLLNEPLPNDWQHTYATELAELYRDLTAAIRRIDPDHLIMYEGSHWATNFSIFDAVWDENSVLQFHRYWMPPDYDHIRAYVEKGRELRLPIYMGEGGENNLEWIYAAHRLYESHGIGWNFWPWKKIETLTSPASVRAPAGWSAIIGYANGGPRPEDAEATLNALLEAMKIENCRWQEDVVRAMTGERPRLIPAWGFSGFSIAGGQSFPGLRPEAAAAIGHVEGATPPDSLFHHTSGRDYSRDDRLVVRLAAGDWLEYELTGVDDAAQVRAFAADATELDLGRTLTPAGLRVEARGPVELAWLRIEG